MQFCVRLWWTQVNSNLWRELEILLCVNTFSLTHKFLAKPFSSLSPRIAGGNVADISKYPYAAYITIKYNNNGKDGQSYCAATIIGDKWILTAGRCYDFQTVKESKFYGGSTKNRGDDAKQSVLKQAILHPQFKPNSDNYDFALVQLETKLNFSDKIDYIDLPTENDKIKTGELCWTAGWGNELHFDECVID